MKMYRRTNGRRHYSVVSNYSSAIVTSCSGTTALDLFAVGVIPIGKFEVFGKAGYSMWDAEVSALGQPSAKDDGSDLAYGLGAAYTFAKFALRLEYEMFDIESNADVDMLSFGFDFRF